MPPLARLTVSGRDLVLRRAVAADLDALVELLADDAIGAGREGIRDEADAERYREAFEAVDADPNALLLIAEVEGELVGTAQLTVITSLSRRGARRGEIEGVRVASAWRSAGIGAAMIRWLIEESRRRGCALVQLTSDKRRKDAIRFYERLGFATTHEGLKLLLD